MTIDFQEARLRNALRKQKKKQKTVGGKCSPKKTAVPVCRPTISVARHSKNVVIICFVDLFDKKTIYDSLASRVYMECGDISIQTLKHKEEGIYGYVIRLKKSLTEEMTQKKLEVCVEEIIIALLRFQVKYKAKLLNIHDLAQSSCFTFSIDKDTIQALLKAGIIQVSALREKSRDELCTIPGMTTKGLFDIECALACRGIFLAVPEISSDYY